MHVDGRHHYEARSLCMYAAQVSRRLPLRHAITDGMQLRTACC